MKFFRLPLYPLFITAFPVLSLYAHNCAYTALSDLFLPLVILFCFFGLVGGLVFLITSSLRKAAFASSAIVLLVCSYDCFFGLLWHTRIGSFAFNNHVNMEIVLFLTIIAMVIVVRILPFRFRSITPILNVVGITLVVIPIATIVQYQLSNQLLIKPASVHHVQHAAADFDSSMPDIYYLIFDRYGSLNTLHQRFGYDNTPFVKFLRDKGFYVLSQSTCNYPKTAYSLASSLGMGYIDTITGICGKNTNNWKPLYSFLRNFKVLDYLQNRGYRFVLCGSWWESTRVNPRADQIINYRSIPEFFGLFYRSTAFFPLLQLTDLVDTRHDQWVRLHYELAELGKIQRVGHRPVFVFAHLLLPHSPYVFDSVGGYLSYDNAMFRNQDSCYRGQLIYANRLIQKLVDTLAAKPRRPVIIMQADEGPHPKAYEKAENRYDWQTAPTEQLLEKFGILNAIFLPVPADTAHLYSSMTPVNTFRTVLSLYCDTAMAKLPDRNYIYRGHRQLYDFIDITPRIHQATGYEKP